MSNKFEVRIIGDGLSPEIFNASDLAEIAKSVEGTIVPVIKRNNPDLEESEIIIGLVGISGGSIFLTFSQTRASGYCQSDQKSLQEVYTAIRTKDITKLPHKSGESFQNILNKQPKAIVKI